MAWPNLQAKLLLLTLVLFVQHSFGNEDEINDFTDDDYLELYSSSSLGLVRLMELERSFIQNISDYVNILEKKGNIMQFYIKNLKRVKFDSNEKREGYIANPVSALGLIRRLYEDWPKWQAYIKAPVEEVNLNAMETELDEKTPIAIDLEEALKGMYRIETTYGLEPTHIANGRLQDIDYNITLSLRDCWVLGDYTYKKGDYARAAQWYWEALHHECKEAESVYNEFLSYHINDLRILYAKAMVRHAPWVEQLKEITQNMLMKYDTPKLDEFVDELLNRTENESVKELRKLKSTPTLNELSCRGLNPKPTNLSCYYNFTTTPFLRIAPLKMEVMNLHPYIVMYHDVIYNNEIESMRKESEPYFVNGWSALTDTFSSKYPRERISRVSWLMDSSPFLEKLNQRIEDITGFNVKEIQPLQVSDAGLGGAFYPHFDYVVKDREISLTDVKNLGDRTASIIFYTGNVKQGGATSFPSSKVAVLPQRGNALFWFNLHDDGSEDPRSLHGVCPVIVGARWTLTKWLHVDPQMFVKPCTLRKKE